MDKKHTIYGTIKAILAAIAYLFLQTVLFSSVTVVLGTDIGSYNKRAVITALFCLPVVLVAYIKKNPGLRLETRAWGRRGMETGADIRRIRGMGQIIKCTMIRVVIAIGFVFCCSIATNNLILSSGLQNLSGAYKSASVDFYSGNVWWLVLSSGILAPFLEELVYRGIVYRGLASTWGSPCGAQIKMQDRGNKSLFLPMLLGAAFFSLIHGNLPQMLYAFVVGFALCVVLQWTQCIAVPVAAHMAANLFAIARTECAVLFTAFERPGVYWGVTIVAVILALFCLFCNSSGRSAHLQR